MTTQEETEALELPGYRDAFDEAWSAIQHSERIPIKVARKKLGDNELRAILALVIPPLIFSSKEARGMREALEDMKYAMEKLNGAVDAMWNDPAGRVVSALHQADITHAQQVIKKTLDDHASTLSPNRPLAEEEK